MTTPSSIDPSSPSESLSSWLKGLHLHPITWVVVVAALLRLGADTIDAVTQVHDLVAGGVFVHGRPASAPAVLAGIAHAYGYSLVFFGTAATVEFLFRIWRELRIRRTGESE